MHSFAMRSPPSSVEFKVHRREPELIAPAMPTPHEFKTSADAIDEQQGIRTHIPVLQVYPSMQGRDPVQAIREALGKALVFHYPFAGRLRKWPDGKLVVECTGEGVLFVEADADFDLQNSWNMLQPPFPLLDELLLDVPGSCGVVNCPLLLVQVTRLKCGGFVFGLRFYHTVFDDSGAIQFMSAIGEMARRQHCPSVLPVWERQLLSARNSLITGDDSTSRVPLIPQDDLVVRSFFFGIAQISFLRRLVALDLRYCGPFEILAACLWKCRAHALQPNPASEMRIICVNKPPNNFIPGIIPKGCYGNEFIFSTAVVTARELLNNPVSYALRCIRKARINTTEEYVQSAMETLAINGRPAGFHMEGTTCIISSHVRHAGFCGLGKAMYGCPAKAIPLFGSFCAPYKNEKGENGLLLPVCLPAQVMKRFANELEILLQPETVNSGTLSTPILSAL